MAFIEYKFNNGLRINCFKMNRIRFQLPNDWLTIKTLYNVNC